MTTCVHCYADVPHRTRKPQPHCLKDECNTGYAKWVYGESTVRDGDCLVWTGRFTGCPTPQPLIKVSTHRDASGRTVAVDYRARAIGMALAGREYGTKRPIRNTCGNERCVAGAHHRLVEHAAEDGLGGHLDAAPLLRWAEIAAMTKPDIPVPIGIKYKLAKARKRGFVTVRTADEVCCEWLGMHPADIYGDEFYEA